MAKFETKFISQNKVPQNSDYIYVYSGEEVVGKIKPDLLKMPKLKSKLYSFGTLSDIHVTESNKEKFKKALNFFNNEERVVFTCIAGDLTEQGTTEQYELYKNCVNEYSKDTPVYEITGNHDVETFTGTTDLVKPYTNKNLYYSFSQGNDLFIMFSMQGWKTTGDTFSTESLQWLYEVLEANINKRCFVFEHCPRFDGSGNPYEPVPTGDLLTGKTGTAFKSLLEHYKNVIWFHGHTHISFSAQKDNPYANYDRKFGCHSVHIPSLATVKTLNSEETGYDVDENKGMGYVVDVYENYIVLRGREFESEKFLPIATYCLDTTPINIEANTFADSTGIINTGGDNL